MKEEMHILACAIISRARLRVCVCNDNNNHNICNGCE